MRLFKIILAVVVLVLIFLLIRQNLDVLNHQVQFKLNLAVFSPFKASPILCGLF